MEKVAVSTDVGSKLSTRSRYPRYVFAVFFAISLLNYLDRHVFTGASNVIAKELGLRLDQVGYITSAFLIVYTLGTVPLGIWADRTRRKNVVALCVGVWSVATALTSLAPNFLLLFLSRMVLGIGEAGYFPAGTALLSDYFHRAQRSRVMSLWSAAQFFGILGGYAIGGILAGLGLWRLAFLFAAIPGLVLAFLAWRLREPRRNQADEEVYAEVVVTANSAPALVEQEPAPPVPARTNILLQCLSLLRIKTLVVLTIVQVFSFFVLGVSSSYLPIYLQQADVFNLSPGVTGIYSGVIIVLGGLIGTYLGGFFADLLERRFSGARVLVSGLGFLLSAPAFVVTLLASNFLVFTISFFITVVLLAIYNGPSTAAIQDVVPSWLRASAVAVTLLIAHLLGDAFAPTLVGLLATIFDPTHGMHFRHGLAGHDLSLALLVTGTPALLIAGVAGIIGARWMRSDVEKAEQEDRFARVQHS